MRSKFDMEPKPISGLAYRQHWAPGLVFVHMNDIYAMQRANGDWYAVEDHGRIRVPLFHSSKDAMTARVRDTKMLLFKPVALDSALLEKIIPKGGKREVDLWMVDDQSSSVNHGALMTRAQLALLIPFGDK